MESEILLQAMRCDSGRGRRCEKPRGARPFGPDSVVTGRRYLQKKTSLP